MYSRELLMIGRGTARNMWIFLTKINLENLVRLLVLLKRNLHIQYIRKVGGSQGVDYDCYRFLGCDIKLSGIYRHFWKHVFHIFKVKRVTTCRTAISVSGNLTTPATAVDMPNTCHNIR
jgi:hypothetical protein